MKINEAMKQLRKLHKEFGEIIDKLEKVDNGDDMGYYEDLLQDIHWSNAMLNNRYKRMEEKIEFNKKRKRRR